MSRLQGQPVAVASYFAVTFAAWIMDPREWASSNPARQVGLEYVRPLTEAGKHVFGTTTNSQTVIAMVRNDPRVAWVELIHQDTQSPMDQIAPHHNVAGLQGPVPRERPAPGSPSHVWNGAIVKYPNEPHHLTWDDVRRAEAGPLGL